MNASAEEMVALACQVWGPQNMALSTRGEARFGRAGSKAVKLDEAVWFDHECNTGGGFRDLYKLANGRFPDNGHDREPEFRPPDGMLRELGAPVAWWDYHTETGKIIARVVRFEPPGADKTFRQCRPGGAGWKWSTRGIEIPLYRLPDLLQATPASTVFITEGEKHSDLLHSWGLIATTNAGGAKKFRTYHAKALANFKCIVLADNDVPGLEHEALVLKEFRAAGCQHVRALRLPGVPPKGDVIDWAAAGGTREALEELVEAPFQPEQPPPPHDEDDLEAAISRLAALPTTRYELARQEEAKRLKVRSSFLDKMVAQARGTDDTQDNQQGRPLNLPVPEPWPEPVDGAQLLGDLRDFFAKHAFLQRGAPYALALWTVHTHTFQVFTHSPRLHVRGIVKNSGKTTVLDLLEMVCCRALPAANVTTAAMFRTIEMAKPTLLLDEADTFLNEAEELRGIVNAGHKRGGQILRTVGDDHTPRMFSVFGPIAIAGIGDLPGTIADRSITIPMKRALKSELPAPITKDVRADADALARKAVRWTLDHETQLTDANPNIGELFNRLADNWRPLFAIADVVGGTWPELVRKTADTLIVTDDATETLGVKLLADIRTVFSTVNVATIDLAGGATITSADLVNSLVKLDERPWAELGRAAKPITQNRLARMLAPFKIIPSYVGPVNDRKRGYELARFLDAFARHLPPTS